MRKIPIDELNKENFLTLKELYVKLGRGFSPRYFKSRIEKGEFKQGIHFIRTGTRGDYRVNLMEIKKYLETING